MKQLSRSLFIATLMATTPALATAAGPGAPAHGPHEVRWGGDASQNLNGRRSSPGADQPRVINAEPDYTPPMRRLMEASDHLRDTIRELAQEQPGANRDAAIGAARKALRDAQQAMIDLPPELRARPESMTDAEYAKATDELKQAAQRLRDSIHAMAQQPPGERRNQAIEQANEAILEVNQAMVMLPTATDTSVSASSHGEANSSMTNRSFAGFDSLDANRDGVISRAEFSAFQQNHRGAVQSAGQ